MNLWDFELFIAVWNLYKFRSFLWLSCFYLYNENIENCHVFSKLHIKFFILYNGVIFHKGFIASYIIYLNEAFKNSILICFYVWFKKKILFMNFFFINVYLVFIKKHKMYKHALKV